MGKSLIIPGADFSENAITESYGWYYTEGRDVYYNNPRVSSRTGDWHYRTSFKSASPINAILLYHDDGTVNPSLAVIDANFNNLTFNTKSVTEFTKAPDSMQTYNDAVLFISNTPIIVNSGESVFIRDFQYGNIEETNEYTESIIYNLQNQTVTPGSTGTVNQIGTRQYYWLFDYGYIFL